MHQDQRIGLALGVLLIGACAAFFFRNETHQRAEIPRLQRAQELDDRIAERSTRPYLTGVGAVEAGDRARLRTVADRGQSSDSSDEDHGASYWSPTESYGSHESKDQRTGSGKPGARFSDSESDIQELEPIPVPSDGLTASRKSRDEELNDGSVASDRGRLKPTDASPDAQTYVVQKGDTLSSIAGKRLGNANRFHEIFDANRDQLKDANDLRSGMVLQIPDSNSVSASKTSTGRGPVSREVEESNSQDSTASMNPLKGSSPSSMERRHPAPGTDVKDTGVSPNQGSNDSRNDTDSEPSRSVESSPSRKFVPSRKFTPPARPVGPQAMLDEVAPSEVAR